MERFHTIRRLVHEQGFTLEGARKRLRSRAGRSEDALGELRRRLAALIDALGE